LSSELHNRWRSLGHGTVPAAPPVVSRVAGPAESGNLLAGGWSAKLARLLDDAEASLD
jgi:hypothetical protein